MIVIRLSRQGYKNRPHYRIVVTDKENPRDSKSLEVLGSFDPLTRGALPVVKKERVEHWLKMGAQPSGAVRKLLKESGMGRAAPAAPGAVS